MKIRQRSANVLDLLSGVLARQTADHRFEIFYQVRLIEITPFGRQLRPIRRFSVRCAESRFVNPAAPYDPFRADADVFINQALQRSFVDTELADGIIHFDDVAVGHDAIHDAASETEASCCCDKLRRNRSATVTIS